MRALRLLAVLGVLGLSTGAGCGTSDEPEVVAPAGELANVPGNTSSSGGTNPGQTSSSSGEPGTTPPGGTLVKTPGNYGAACDGSGGVSIDGRHFLALNDETQVLRIYEQGGTKPAVQELDISTSLDLTTKDEADFEDAARVGNRIYVITSHGRKKTGKLDEARYKFFAIDVSGAVPSVSLKVAGAHSFLLEDMLDAKNWKTPDVDFIELLESTSQLSEETVEELAPKDQGTNMEGLAALPGGKLAIGFRNPKTNADAMVVTLLNADAVVGGATAEFGETIKLNLGGFGIRGMTWSEEHKKVLILSGPHDESNGPFALWTWTGVAGNAPVKVTDVTAPAGGGAEAIIPYPGTKDVQVLFDMSTSLINGAECAEASAAEKRFTDVVISVP